MSYRIKSINDIVLDSANSGKVQHNAEVQYNHSNDSFLSDIKALKGVASGHEILKVAGDGSSLTKVTSADFFDGYQTDLFTKCDSRYLQSTDEFVKSVAGGSKLSVTAGAIDVDLADYETQAQAEAKYLQSADLTDYMKKDGSVAMTGDLIMGANKINFRDTHELTVTSGGALTFNNAPVAYQGSNIDMSNNVLQNCNAVWFHSSGNANDNELKADVSGNLTYQGDELAKQSWVGDNFLNANSTGANLNIVDGVLGVDLTDYQQIITLDSDVANLGYIKIGDVPVAPSAYIESVQAGSVLSVSGSELQIDLSGYVAKDEVDITLQSSFSVASSTGDSKEKKYVWDVSAVSSPNTLQSISLASGKVYEVSAKFVIRGSSGYGVVERKGLYRLNAGSAVLISSTDSSSVTGSAEGGELTLGLSSSNVNVNVSTSVSAGSTVNGCVVVTVVETA